VLAPCDGDDVDGFQLNLFAIKPDRAQSLETQGLVVRSGSSRPAREHDLARDWADVLGQRPYAGGLVSAWRQRISGDAGDMPQELVAGLSLYCRAWDASLAMAERFDALRAAHAQFSLPQRLGAETARLYSLARVAWELGLREQAIGALNGLCAKVASHSHAPDDTPFLAVSRRFDDIAPGDAFADWCLASVLDQRERLAAFSSYFQDEQALDSLETLRRLPFQCAEMERRRQLMRIRLGRQAAPESTPLLARQSDDNLNPEFWSAASSGAKSA
jgi:protein O-GlcNAc transferase